LDACAGAKFQRGDRTDLIFRTSPQVGTSEDTQENEGMKRTDLEKLKGSTIKERMKGPSPARFGAQAGAAAVSRKEQREQERARGLVPFAVKLDSALAERVRARATERGADLNDVVAELLEKGLGEKK
jgi:hypothetical protein